jgi:hypothetical protein
MGQTNVSDFSLLDFNMQDLNVSDFNVPDFNVLDFNVSDLSVFKTDQVMHETGAMLNPYSGFSSQFEIRILLFG